MKTTVTRFLTELLLWNLANVVCVAIPTGAVFLIGKHMLGWGPGFLSFYLSAAVLATLTWGSWASLVWTRNRVLRGGMHASTVMPGLLVVLAGGAGLWVGFGAWWLWVALIAAGIGMAAAAVGLTRAFGQLDGPDGLTTYLLGFSLYPLATTAGGLAIGALWYSFVNNPGGGWRSLISLATLMVTVLAAALVTTVIPAVVSTGCRKITIDLDRRLH